MSASFGIAASCKTAQLTRSWKFNPSLVSPTLSPSQLVQNPALSIIVTPLFSSSWLMAFVWQQRNGLSMCLSVRTVYRAWHTLFNTVRLKEQVQLLLRSFAFRSVLTEAHFLFSNCEYFCAPLPACLQWEEEVARVGWKRQTMGPSTADQY